MGVALVSTGRIPGCRALTLGRHPVRGRAGADGRDHVGDERRGPGREGGRRPDGAGGYAGLKLWELRLTAEVGASLYMVMAAGWTYCFVAAGTGSRTLTWLSVATWASLAVGSVGLLLPERLRRGPPSPPPTASASRCWSRGCGWWHGGVAGWLRVRVPFSRDREGSALGLVTLTPAQLPWVAAKRSSSDLRNGHFPSSSFAFAARGRQDQRRETRRGGVSA